MAVTNNATLIEDFEGAGPTYTVIGGGKNATNNTDIFIAGSQSGGKRSDNATGTGFYANPGAVTDLTGTGEHAKFFLWVTQYDQVTAASVRIGDSTTVYETHTITVGEWPPLGGWFAVWVEVDAGTDTGSPNFANSDEFGFVISINDVGGNAENQIMDQIHHSTRPVLTWDGSTGDFADFVTTSDSNALAVLIDINGALNLYANVQIGSATATTFTDSGVVILAPNFSHLPTATTWQGIDIDLQNASTVVTWTGSVYGASDVSQTRKPDLLVTGRSGSADLSDNRFQGLRIVDLNDACTAENTVFDTCGQIDLTSGAGNTAGADISGATITGSTVAADSSALLWNVNADPDGELDNTTHIKGTNAHHAIEFGSSSPLTMTVRGWTTSGYNASDAQNDSTFYFADRGSDVTWTVNVVGGTGNFSFKKARAGDTVNIVISPVTTKIIAKDENNANLQNARVLFEAGDGAGDLPFEDTVTITRSGSTASVSHTAHGLASGEKVVIRGADQQEYNGIQTISNVTANAYDYTVTGTPATPATGTIDATGVIVEGLTSALGEVSASRSFTVNQAGRGYVAKATTAPLYKRQTILDTVDKDNGLTRTVSMVRDD